jgi:hypothetical protein
MWKTHKPNTVARLHHLKALVEVFVELQDGSYIATPACKANGIAPVEMRWSLHVSLLTNVTYSEPIPWEESYELQTTRGEL